MEANLVERRVAEEVLLWLFPIENGEPNDWNSSNSQVVNVKEHAVVNLSARHLTVPTKSPHRNDKYNVFVEHVHDQVAVSSVCLSSVTE